VTEVQGSTITDRPETDTFFPQANTGEGLELAVSGVF
jgi:hypothetical protein